MILLNIRLTLTPFHHNLLNIYRHHVSQIVTAICIKV